jgi:hypothetical protein
MGIIGTFASIRSIADVSMALRFLIEDMIPDANITGSSDDSVEFMIEWENDAVSFEVTIQDTDDKFKRREESLREVIGWEWPTWQQVKELGTGEANRRLAHPALTDDERHVVQLFQDLEVPRDKMTRRMMGVESGVSDDHAVLLEAFARSGLSVGTVVRFIHLRGENDDPRFDGTAQVEAEESGDDDTPTTISDSPNSVVRLGVAPMASASTD